MADFWEEYRKATNTGQAQSDPFWDAYRSGQQTAIDAPEGQPLELPGAVPSDPNSVGSTLGRATDQLQSNFGGSIEALGEFVGSDYLKTMGATIRKENLEEAAQYGVPENSTWSEVQGVEDVPEYLKQLGLSAVPGLGVVLGGAVAGGRVGAVGGPVTATIGAGVGGLLAGMGINVGEIQNRIKAENPDLQAPGMAIGAGAAMSALDAVGAGALLRPLIKRFGAEYVYEGLVRQGVMKETAASAIRSAAAESVTEVAQEAVSEAGTAQAVGRSFDTEAFLDRAIDAFIGGGLVGGVAGAPVGAVGAIENNLRVSDQDMGETSLRDMSNVERVSTLKKTFYGVANRPTAMLEPLANVSPTAEDFLDTFRRDTNKLTQASKMTIGEQQELMTGGWRTEAEPALDALTNQDVHDIAQGNVMNPKAVTVRKVLDNVLEEARKAGLNVGQIENYLPLNIDPMVIQENKQQFVNEIAPYIKVKSKGVEKQASVAQVNNLVDQWLKEATKTERDVIPISLEKKLLDPKTLEAAKSQQFKGDPKTVRVKVAQGSIPPEFGQLEKNRTFAQVPQDVLLKWTAEGDNPRAVRQSIEDYLEGASHRIAFAREFGNRGERANYKIARIVSEAARNGRDVGMDEVQRMYDILDAYNNMYSPVKSQTARRAQSFVGAFVTTTTLPLVLLSSLTEVVLPAVRGELGIALAQVAPTLRTVAAEMVRKSFSKTPRSGISLQMSQANLSLAASENVVASRLGQNIFNQGASRFLRGFFKAVGLTHWTHFMRMYSAHVAKAIIDRDISELASGLPVDSPRGRYLRTQLAELGVEINSAEKAKMLNAPSTTAEKQEADAARVAGIRRFVEETILEPGFEDKPLWMSNGHLQLIAHLKGYPTMFTNTVLPQVARRFSPSRVGGYYASQGFIQMLSIFAFMLLVGYMQDYMKQVVKNGEVNYDEQRTEAQILLDVAQLTFMPIHMSYLVQTVSAPRYGTSGLAAALGPTAGKAEEGIETIYRFIDDPEEGEIWKYMYKEMTPFGFFRPGRETAKELEFFD